MAHYDDEREKQSDKKSKRGRKKIIVTPEDIKKVEQLASRGLMDKEIMALMGWKKDFFYEKKREMSEFSEAIEKGRATGHASIANKLWESAHNGNVSAMQYYLARRAGWTEKQEINHQSSDGTMTPKEAISEEAVKALIDKLTD